MPSYSTTVIIRNVLIGVLAVVIWEHCARINQFSTWCRPSALLDLVATLSWDFFAWLGRGFAYLSSFITYLHLDEFWATIKALMEPIIKILGSWIAIPVDYCHVAVSYATPVAVFIGSAVLITLGMHFLPIQKIPHWEHVKTFFHSLHPAWWMSLLIFGLIALGLRCWPADAHLYFHLDYCKFLFQPIQRTINART